MTVLFSSLDELELPWNWSLEAWGVAGGLIAAIGTVGALLASLFLIRSERDARRQEERRLAAQEEREHARQARLIQAWFTKRWLFEDVVADDLVISNHSGLAIFDVSAAVEDTETQAMETTIEATWNTIDAGEEVSAGLDFKPEETHGPVIFFTDAAGRRWTHSLSLGLHEFTGDL
ncbi:hypothetical protein [Dermatobacter hominis]|uniref:hypothetical protein n=1 Tax=Dermatobacter hominis TaxID=2884263 RepID=UPI001D11515E|nr:hypothetical protein [Dermatobacter hominis]UDY35532.1 hypothetical protein LH044_19650 [Dermatobacter hominis]